MPFMGYKSVIQSDPEFLLNNVVGYLAEIVKAQFLFHAFQMDSEGDYKGVVSTRCGILSILSILSTMH